MHSSVYKYIPVGLNKQIHICRTTAVHSVIIKCKCLKVTDWSEIGKFHRNSKTNKIKFSDALCYINYPTCLYYVVYFIK